MAKKRLTNEQLVKRMMTVSRRGALAQAFIMQAIEKYADACADADPKVFDSGFMSGEAWVDVAKEIRDQIKEHYAS